MLMMKIFGLILGQSYTTSTTSTMSSFSSSGDAATSGKLARKALARREKRILMSMLTTHLTLKGIAAVEQRQLADRRTRGIRKREGRGQ